MSRRFRTALSLLSAICAVLLTVAYGNVRYAAALSQRSEALERYGGEVTELLVATCDLEPGDELGPANCQQTEWLSELAPDGALSVLEEAEGLTVTSPVTKGSVITEAQLRTSDDELDIPAGRVALTVPVSDKLGVTRSVSKGDTLAAYEIVGEVTRLVTSNVTVVDSVVGSAGSLTSLTIALLPEDVSAVMAASSANTLRLVQPASDVVELDDGLAPDEVAAVDSTESVDVEGDS